MEDVDLRNFCCSYDKIYIYGAGRMARFAASELERLECKYEAFVVSDGLSKNEWLYGHKIFYLAELDIDAKNVGFILGLDRKNTNEVLTSLKEKGYYNIFSLADERIKTDFMQMLSLEERCNLLEKYSRQDFNIAVLLCNFRKQDRTTHRYRAHNMQQIMHNTVCKWRLVYFFSDEIEVLKELFPQISIITLLRLEWTYELEQFIQSAQKQEKCILYDIDDLMFDLDVLPLLMDTTNTSQSEDSYQKVFATIARNFLLASRANGFIATNQYLAQKLSNKFSKLSAVIPNFLNYEQLEISEKLCEKLAKQEFIIGYFSGSNTHTKDFGVCYKEIMLLMEEFPDIKLRVVGYMDFPVEMEELLENGRIENLPYVDFRKLQKLISEVDVNIAPLVINDFTNCKSELKFFEAAIVKTITCASPTYIFENCITDGVNGFLCSEGDWYKKIKHIYLREVDLDKIRENAYQYTLENYTGLKIVEAIENAYNMFKDPK